MGGVEATFNDGLLGFRTPCVILGPRAQRGHVSHFRFDPGSVLNLIRWRFGLDGLCARDDWSKNMAMALDFRNPPNLDAPAFGQLSPEGLTSASRGLPWGKPCYNYLTNQLPLPADMPAGMRAWYEHQSELRPLYEMSKAAGLI
jgi:phospholipase C